MSNIPPLLTSLCFSEKGCARSRWTYILRHIRHQALELVDDWKKGSIIAGRSIAKHPGQIRAGGCLPKLACKSVDMLLGHAVAEREDAFDRLQVGNCMSIGTILCAFYYGAFTGHTRESRSVVSAQCYPYRYWTSSTALKS